MAWQQGRSAKHPANIAVVLSLFVGWFNASPFDVDYVTVRAAQIGADALALWHETARTRIQRHSISGTPLLLCNIHCR